MQYMASDGTVSGFVPQNIKSQEGSRTFPLAHLSGGKNIENVITCICMRACTSIHMFRTLDTRAFPL